MGLFERCLVLRCPSVNDFPSGDSDEALGLAQQGLDLIG